MAERPARSWRWCSPLYVLMGWGPSDLLALPTLWLHPVESWRRNATPAKQDTYGMGEQPHEPAA